LLTIDPQHARWLIKSPHETISSSDDYSVFCRDWELPSIASTDNLAESVAIEETGAFLNAWVEMLPRERCVDHPLLQRRLENKLVQIPLAKAAGLRVPQTIAGNDPEQVRRFVVSRPSIIKLLSNVSFTGIEGQGEFVYTSRIGDDQKAFLDEVENCPVLVQEVVEKVADVRVTVVGDRIFPAIISPCDASTDTVDFRERRNEPARPFPIDSAFADAIRRLAASMCIQFAAIDFGLTADGSLIFFEANLTGNWLWIEREARFPITLSIAEKLAVL
jgi:glutathione synthase/RimK-type ligase-like ATP-grasp enzyme